MKSDVVDDQPKQPKQPKQPPVKYAGSRFSSLILLVVTVLISLFFYASGQ